jgi:hypothetical protein
MKLSKLTKEAIVRAIWNEVPEIDYKVRKEAIHCLLRHRPTAAYLWWPTSSPT